MDSEEWLWPNQATVGTKGKWPGYTNWDAGEPNNHGGKDEEVTFMNYWGSLNMPLPRSEAHIQRHLGKWYDGGRQMRIWYVCERIYVDEKVCEDEAWQHFNGSCYKFNETRADYESAVSACDAQGAQLVKIESAEENAYVQGLCGRKTCWLGLAEPPDSEDWYWVDGTKANLESNWFGKMDWKGYTNWDWGEPNNHNGTDEDATFMNLWLHLGMLEPWSVEH